MRHETCDVSLMSCCGHASHPHPQGRTALHHAAMRGYGDVCSLLISRGRAYTNARDSNRATPLMLASAMGSLKVMAVLLEGGALLDLPDADQATPLMAAAKAGHAPALELLLRYGAKANLRDKDGCTALIMSAAAGHVECVYVLLCYKAELDVQQYNGRTALMMACQEVRTAGCSWWLVGS